MGTFLFSVLNVLWAFQTSNTYVKMTFKEEIYTLDEEMILEAERALEDEQNERDDRPVCVVCPVLTTREIKKDKD